MSDTGQIPGEGLPENAGMVEQPGNPAPGAYTFLAPSEHASEDDDLLLMPSPQGAWSEPQVAPVPGQPVGGGDVQAPAPLEGQAAYQTQPQGYVGGVQAVQAQGPVQVQEAPDPAVYAVQQAVAGAMTETGQGTHESGGRDSGAVDLNGVRMPAPASVAAPVAAAPVRKLARCTAARPRASRPRRTAGRRPAVWSVRSPTADPPRRRRPRCPHGTRDRPPPVPSTSTCRARSSARSRRRPAARGRRTYRNRSRCPWQWQRKP